jgi:hypothetical protein
VAEAPALVDLIGPLLMIAAVLFAIGCGVLITYFVRALFGTIASLVGGIPLIGGVTASVIHSAERAITTALGNGIARMEGFVGRQWVHLSQYLHNLWEYQVGVAENLWHLAQRLGHSISRGEIDHLLHRALHGLEAAVAKGLHSLLHDWRWIEKKAGHLAHAVFPRIGRLEHAVDWTIPREIKTARDLAKEAEHGVANLWKRVRTLPTKAEVTAAIAAALAAVGFAGLEWLRCDNGAERVGRSGCGLWDDLGDVFALLAAAELALNFETFVHDAQEATGITVAAVKDVAGLG